MEQILINLIAGAVGGNAVGKSSPTFDLGTLGNTIAGLVGGGVREFVRLLLWRSYRLVTVMAEALTRGESINDSPVRSVEPWQFAGKFSPGDSLRLTQPSGWIADRIGGWLIGFVTPRLLYVPAFNQRLRGGCSLS